jgi:RimJ/RimL family protein N-acetyltransferase
MNDPDQSSGGESFSMSDYHVRRAVPLDAPGYIALIRSVLTETPRVDTPYAPDEFNPSVEAMRERIREMNASDNSLFLVAETRSAGRARIIGALTCGGGSLRSDHHMTDLGIYVRRDWRDRGVGTALMRAAIDWARASPVIQRVQLEVYARNARAIHLYEKFGFEHEGCKRRLYLQDGQPLDMLIMALILDKPNTGETDAAG